MSFYLLFICSLLIVNFQSVIPFRFNRFSNEQYGQEEYYYPAYFDYTNDNIDNLEHKLLQPKQQQTAKQISTFDSQFPSLKRPGSQGVSVEGPNRFTKYKHYQTHLLSSNNEDVKNANLIKYLTSSKNILNNKNHIPNYLIKNNPNEANGFDLNNVNIDDNDNNNNGRRLNLLQAMKKAYNYNNIRDNDVAAMANIKTDTDDNANNERTVKRKALNENVLESNMYEHPKNHINLESPAGLTSSMLHANSKDYHSPPLPYHQTFISPNYKKVSILSSISDFYFIVIVAFVSSIAIFSVIGAGYCFYKVQQQNKAATEVEFPAYGIVGPACRTDNITPPKDRKLTQSAQMYHYQHQKQQMISNEKNASIPKHQIGSDIESDEENEDGEYTVYECPGLAPTGEMEVKNPLFQDDLTPMDSPGGNKLNSAKEAKN